MIGGAGRRPRRRFEAAGGEEGGGEATATAAASAGRMCRSCAAVAVADCVALACCPCAVVSLLGLALVRAPLAVGRLLIRTRRRRRALLRGKRVRDVAAAAAPAPGDDCEKGAQKEADVRRGVDSTSTTADGDLGGVDDHEAELAWLEEMYRTGRWGFGRVSFSAKTP